MLIVPKEKPILSNLNSYYLDISRLLEHYQGEVGAGAVFFHASAASGVIFFDQTEILNSYFQDKNKELLGEPAFDRLIQAGSKYNFSVDIFRLPLEEVYFWSSLPTSEKIYKDLSAEFTDLEGLIKKMGTERLTGFIDVSINQGKEGGLVFFSNGEIVGGSFSWGSNESAKAKKNVELLIEESKKSGGTFQVCRIPLGVEKHPEKNDEAQEPLSDNSLKMIEEFMNIFETLYTSRRRKEADFNSLIRKKFVDNADKFTFLDPFAAEFEYSNRKITFSGKATDRDLSVGVITSILELSEEIGISGELRQYLLSWSKKYEERIAQYNIDL